MLHGMVWGELYLSTFCKKGTRCGAAGSGTALQIFRYHSPSGRTMALGSTEPLTQLSTRSMSCGVKAAGS